MKHTLLNHISLSDLDQLREIMKITGTPSPDFIVKLQSQDVSNNPGLRFPLSMKHWL